MAFGAVAREPRITAEAEAAARREAVDATEAQLVGQAKIGEQNVLSDGRRALKAALDESGKPKIMLPQMIMAKFTQMLTGKAAKNEARARRRRKEAAAAAAVPVVIAAPAKTVTKRGAWAGRVLRQIHRSSRTLAHRHPNCHWTVSSLRTLRAEGPVRRAPGVRPGYSSVAGLQPDSKTQNHWRDVKDLIDNVRRTIALNDEPEPENNESFGGRSVDSDFDFEEMQLEERRNFLEDMHGKLQTMIDEVSAARVEPPIS